MRVRRRERRTSTSDGTTCWVMPRDYGRAPTNRCTERSEDRDASCEQNGAVPSSEPYDAGPVAALRRIAFLLERGRAETYKVKAFRTAAATVLPLPADEVDAPGRRAARSRELPGIGPTTAAVIADAVAGAAAGAAGQARARDAAARWPTAATELRAALRGDLHSHSDWSDGGSPIEEMAFTAIELGHDYLVLTDHSPRLTVANGLSRRPG